MSDLYSEAYESSFKDFKSRDVTRSDLSFRNVTPATVWRVGMGRTGCGEDSIEATPTRKGSKAVTVRPKSKRGM